MTTITKSLPVFAAFSATALLISRIVKTATPPRVPHWTEYLRETRDN